MARIYDELSSNVLKCKGQDPDYMYHTLKFHMSEYSKLGRTKVGIDFSTALTNCEIYDPSLRIEDRELMNCISKRFKNEGVKVVFSSRGDIITCKWDQDYSICSTDSSDKDYHKRCTII